MVLKAKFLEANDLNGCQCFSWVTEQGVLTSDVRYFINKFAYLISFGKYFLGLTNHIVPSHLAACYWRYTGRITPPLKVFK